MQHVSDLAAQKEKARRQAGFFAKERGLQMQRTAKAK
jgi:hypothetical protein